MNVLTESLDTVRRETERLQKADDLLGEIIATLSLEQNRKEIRVVYPQLLELADRWINRYNRINGK